MDFSVLELSLLVGLLVIALLFLRSWNTKRKLLPLPPGPRPRPLIGNLLDFPTEGHEWIFWAKHKELYGPISSLQTFGSTFIIINDIQTASNLMDKKSGIYSNRPKFTMSHMSGWSWITPLIQYNERLRGQRKLMYQFMGTRDLVSRFHGQIYREARHLLYNILRTPDDFFGHIRMYTGAVILKITYGYDTDHFAGVSDPLVRIAERTMKTFLDSITPGRYLVDMIPLMKQIPVWFPGATFRRTAKKYIRMVEEFSNKPFMFVKQQKAFGVDSQCFASDILESKWNAKDEHEIAKWSAASMYAGGTDTTTAVVTNFFLAMVLNPEVQRKAQEEIDTVIGTDALPSFEDRENLPYVNACVLEAYRWHPPVPLGVPHCVARDDVYQGMLIPKGSLILANIWNLAHDEKVFHDPFAFKPERYLPHRRPDTGDILHGPERRPQDFVFGFGRRSCPGVLVSEATVFISVVLALAAFKLEAPDSVGEGEAAPGMNFCSGMASQAMPFKCKIAPRSNRAKMLVETLEKDPLFAKNDAEKLSNLLDKSIPGF